MTTSRGGVLLPGGFPSRPPESHKTPKPPIDRRWIARGIFGTLGGFGIVAAGFFAGQPEIMAAGAGVVGGAWLGQGATANLTMRRPVETDESDPPAVGPDARSAAPPPDDDLEPIAGLSADELRALWRAAQVREDLARRGRKPQ